MDEIVEQLSPQRAASACPLVAQDAAALSVPIPAHPPTPTPTATMIAELSGQDVAAVEAALVGVREAAGSDDRRAIEGALAEQAALLQALGLKLLEHASSTTYLPGIQAFTSLSLRAFEGARKTLAMLMAGRRAPQSQTNVQVNVGGNTNELLEQN